MAHQPLAWIDDELERLESSQLLRRLAVRDGMQSASRIELDSRRYVNFGANDYLGLAADKRVIRAACDAARRVGWGSGASPLVSGRETLHQRLEFSLARFECTDSALLFPTGFAANVGAITSLVGREDIIFSDADNHASIIDGCRLSRARVQIYPHNDVDFLRSHLVQAARFRRRLIVTDSLFSMTGDAARLADLAELAEQYDAMLYADEAHATGVFGRCGRGIAEEQDVEDGVQVRVGTLSKALGSQGGFVAGPHNLIRWLANRSRPFVFSTASPAACSAAALESLRIVEAEPQRRSGLCRRANQLRQSLLEQGWDVGQTASQIIPILVGCPAQTMQLANSLREAGFYIPAIRPPSVPEGRALLRIGLSYLHTDQDLDGLLSALRTLTPLKTG